MLHYPIQQWSNDKTLVFQIRQEHIIVILSIMKLFSFFRIRIRSSLLVDNYKKLFLFGRLVFLDEHNFFFSLCWIRLVGKYKKLNSETKKLSEKLNQQSPWNIRIFFILCLISCHSRVWGNFLFYNLISTHPEIWGKKSFGKV